MCLTALTRMLEGTRKVGRPKHAWRTTVEREERKQGWGMWSNARHIAIDKAREPQWSKNGDNRAGGCGAMPGTQPLTRQENHNGVRTETAGLEDVEQCQAHSH